MKIYKCKICGHCISKQQIEEIADQMLGCGKICARLNYKTCMICGVHELELSDSVVYMSSSYFSRNVLNSMDS